MNGKMLRVGDEFIVPVASGYWLAKATTVFGGTSHPDLEITTSDLSIATLSEAEGRSSNLDIELSTQLSHAAIAPGSDVVLEMAYDNNWTQMTTCVLDADETTYGVDGQIRRVSGIGKAAKKLAAWSPDQGVYIPSMAGLYDAGSSMKSYIRATGKCAQPRDHLATGQTFQFRRIHLPDL